MFHRRPSIFVGDFLIEYAIGSAKAFGEGRIYAVNLVMSDPRPTSDERWPWEVESHVVAGARSVAEAPTIGDIGVSPSSVRRISYMRLTDEQGRLAHSLIGAS